MMKLQSRLPVLIIALSLLCAAPPAFAQGKGQGQGQEGKGNKQERAKVQKGKQDNVARGKTKQAGNDQSRGQAVKVSRPDHRGSSSDIARAERKAERGNAKRFMHVVNVNDMKPEWRRLAVSQRA